MAQRRLPRLRGRDPVARRRHPLLAVLADLDQAALRALRTRAHGRVPDAVMKTLGMAGEWGAVWAATAATAAAVDGGRRRRWMIAGAVGPAAIGVNFAVKVAVGRKRPVLEEHPPLARAPTKLSFPSAHATSSLAAATAMGRIAPGGRPVLYGLAAAICLSRPYLGMHYPSDVVAGAALGIALGRLVPGLDGGPPTGGSAEPHSAAP
ncbi:MAG TPA: phosphatase PAP2 family protein [Solirubrobacterales bacterium]|nr:phosphatase PAP2 family protein [Solirubrobacterales bacterium]